MKTIADRIKEARTARGFASPSEAAKAFGWNKNTYTQHENGIRKKPKDEALARYAKAFGVSLAWLRLGVGDKTRLSELPRVRFAGTIGAGQIVYPSSDIEETIETTVCETGEAFEVRGDSMIPLAHDGDIVFFEPPRPPKSLVGRECIVELTDGRRLFKTIERGTREGLYILISYNAEPIRDVEIVNAGEFAGLRRRKRR